MCSNIISTRDDLNYSAEWTKSQRKRIGLLGGVSWYSTWEYYRRINSYLAQASGANSPGVCVVDLDFYLILKAQDEDDTAAELRLVTDGIKRLCLSGAELILICSNTTSRTASQAATGAGIKLINLIDVVSSFLTKREARSILLLGTKYVMERIFYRSALERSGLSIEIPNEQDRNRIHKIIYDELCLGICDTLSRDWFETLIEKYCAQSKFDHVILGCTELSLLTRRTDIAGVKLVDTIQLHIDEALQQGGYQTE